VLRRSHSRRRRHFSARLFKPSRSCRGTGYTLSPRGPGRDLQNSSPGCENLSSFTLPVSVPLRVVETAMNRSDASPTMGMQVLSATIHLLGPTILAHLISRTVLHGSFTLKGVSWPWICALIILIDSWLFVFASGLLTLGVGLEANDGSCATGIFLCIVFYGTSKFFVYAFLCSSSLPCIQPSFTAEPCVAEGVHTVWQPAPNSRRLQCKPYVGCVMVLFGYCGIIGVLFYGRFPYLGS